MKRLALLFLLLPSLLYAQNEPAGFTPVFRQGSGLHAFRPTYIAAVSGQATTAAYLLSIESSATLGFRVAKICISSSPATAAAAVTVTVQRRTTASSGGTALTAEGTGTTAVTAMDSGDGNFTGIARLNGTPGTGGAVVDQWSLPVGVVASTTVAPIVCKEYGSMGEKAIKVSSGVANGLSVNVSAAGAGGLAAGSISVTFLREN